MWGCGKVGRQPLTPSPKPGLSRGQQDTLSRMSPPQQGWGWGAPRGPVYQALAPESLSKEGPLKAELLGRPALCPPPAPLPRLRTAPRAGKGLQGAPTHLTLQLIQASGLHGGGDRRVRSGLTALTLAAGSWATAGPPCGRARAEVRLGGPEGPGRGECGKELCTYLAPTAYQLSRAHYLPGPAQNPEGEGRQPFRGQT